MDEAEVRSRFDKEVGALNKGLLWGWLKDQRYVAEVCNGYIGWEEFKRVADEQAGWQWRLLQRNKPPGREPRYHAPFNKPIEVELTASEAEHTATLARQASHWPEVRGFRADMPGGGALEPGGVVAFLRSELSSPPREGYADLEWDLEGAPQTWLAARRSSWTSWGMEEP